MADRILAHAHEWLLAHPSFVGAERRAKQRAWKHRLLRPLPEEVRALSRWNPRRLFLSLRRGVPTAYLCKLSACCAAVFVLVGVGPQLGSFRRYHAFVLIVLVGAVFLRSLSTFPGGLRAGWRCTRQTLLTWLQYDRITVEAPGLFASSYGDFFSRIVRTLVLLSGLSLAVQALTVFMPVAGSFTLAGDRAIFSAYYEYGARAADDENSYLIRQGLKPLSRTFADPPRLPRWAVVLKPMLRSFRPSPPPSLGGLVKEAMAGTLERAKETGDGTELVSYYRPLRDGEVDDWIDQELTRFNSEWPDRWMAVSMLGLCQSQYSYLFVIIANVSSCIIFPALLLLVFIAFPAPAVIGGLYADQKKLAPHEIWDAFATRLLESENQLEREHLWLGVHSLNDYPAIVHRKIVSEHAYLVGDTGSGKTALGIVPLLTQIIRHSGRDIREETELAQGSQESEAEVLRHGRTAGSAMVIIDLKGDMSLFENTRIEAQNAGQTFKFFTNEIDKTTFGFNPFRDLRTGKMSVNSTCEAILESLNLSHGEGYGRSYFTRHARKWLSATLLRDKFQTDRPSVNTFGELFRLIADDSGEGVSSLFESPDQRRDVFELLSVIQSLASFDQLNVTAGDPAYPDAVAKSVIHMPDVIANNEIVYFWLPAAVEVASVREIAKLAIYSLLRAAASQSLSGEKPKQTYLVIDEFQRMASEGFKIILEQARSMGISAILANQTVADLQTHDTDLRSTVQTNTRFKQCFAATDLNQQDDMMKASGEMLRETSRTISVSSDDRSSLSKTYTATSRLLRNRILWTGDDPFQSIIQVHRGSGFTQYGGLSIPVAGTYHISAAEHARRSAASWPEQTDETFVAHDRPLSEFAFGRVEDRVEAGEETGELERDPQKAPRSKRRGRPKRETATSDKSESGEPDGAPTPLKEELVAKTKATPPKDHRAYLKAISSKFFEDDESD